MISVDKQYSSTENGEFVDKQYSSIKNGESVDEQYSSTENSVVKIRHYVQIVRWNRRGLVPEGFEVCTSFSEKVFRID